MSANLTSEIGNQQELESDLSSNKNNTEFPPINQKGVPQPELTVTDFIVILFMFGLWGYSIHLTFRAYKKILAGISYAPDNGGNNLWKFIMDVVRAKRKGSQTEGSQDGVAQQADYDEATGLLNGDVKHEKADVDPTDTDTDNAEHQIEVDENSEQDQEIYQDARSIESCNLQIDTGESVTSAVVHSQIQITSDNQPANLSNNYKLNNLDEDHENRRDGELIRIDYIRGDIEESVSSDYRLLCNTKISSTNISKDLCYSTNSEQSLYHKPLLMRQGNSSSCHKFLPSQNGEIYSQEFQNNQHQQPPQQQHQLSRYETPRDMRLVQVVNQHNQHAQHQQHQHVHHQQVQHQTSSDFKFSSDDSFKTVYSSDNTTQQYNNHNSHDKSSYSEQTNIGKPSANKSGDLNIINTNSFEIPTDFPTNGFLYNAIWEKKSTYV